MKHILMVILLLFSAFFPKAQEQRHGGITMIGAGDDKATILHKAAHVSPSPRQARWQELEFTVFFHFGMNTFTDREWGIKGTSPALFNPTALDAEQWVKTAKMAGARLVIMVAKHHDGFCLWPSKSTDYTVNNSPWKGGKGDVVAEVAAACRKQGMKLGIYLSPWDMNSSLYGTEAYNEFFRNQLTELLSGYGPVEEVWFDGACGEGPNGVRQVYDWLRYYRVVRKLQPQAVIAVMGPDVRWVGTESGYGREAEWSVVPVPETCLREPGSGDVFPPPGDLMAADLGSREKIGNARGLMWYPSEVDVSIRPGWFYHHDQDTAVKRPEELVDIYCSSVGRNSVLLLNLPPDQRGLIHENDVAALQKMRSILDATFGNDLAKNVPALRNDSMILLKPNGKVTFDRVMLQENFRQGQRVESFVIEYLDDAGWKELARGTTIGYKRILRFQPMRANQIRLRITSARDVPEITHFGLYKAPQEP